MGSKDLKAIAVRGSLRFPSIIRKGWRPCAANISSLLSDWSNYALAPLRADHALAFCPPDRARDVDRKTSVAPGKTSPVLESPLQNASFGSAVPPAPLPMKCVKIGQIAQGPWKESSPKGQFTVPERCSVPTAGFPRLTV